MEATRFWSVVEKDFLWMYMWMVKRKDPQHHKQIRVCPVLLTIQRFLQAMHRGIVVWQPHLAGSDLLRQAKIPVMKAPYRHIHSTAKIPVMKAPYRHICSRVCPVLTIQRFLQAIHKGIVVWQPLFVGPDLLIFHSQEQQDPLNPG
ncbi:unnamed protein product [Arctogadus glacialis]